ncbi:hypothetical protein ACP43V_11035 [Vibrio genomosp. F10 str. 9ZC157]|uniref:hypothetical protein n=1 Tax=Vibrio genomosp. F10 TaxID=723171 RepID=UPI0002F9EEB9|nr:hypothetical protein [Vibrio genomosp. F10]OEE94834.1 hypothetical protein A1QM_18310 [Vibrio genomosp. F10 str. 9ZC157]
MKYIKYLSLGNTVGLDNEIESYWEIDSDGNILRSVDILPNGVRLKYSENHEADKHGQLPEGLITEDNLKDTSFGLCIELEKYVFELEWQAKSVNCS